MQELVRLTNHSVAQKIQLTPNALRINGVLSLEEWEYGGMGLSCIEDGINFWVGDHLNYGDDNFEEFSQALEWYIEKLGKAERTLMKYMYVCRRIPPDRRRNLSFSHHEEVIRVSDDEKMYQFLDIAERDKLPVKGEGSLRELIDTFLGETLPTLTLKKFLDSIIKKIDSGENELGKEQYYEALKKIQEVVLNNFNRLSIELGIEIPADCSHENCKKPEQKEKTEITHNGNIVKMNAKTEEFINRHLKKGL